VKGRAVEQIGQTAQKLREDADGRLVH
jgi:hypothetical protein